MIQRSKVAIACRGYTLIEIVLVTAIVGILAGISALTLRGTASRYSFLAEKNKLYQGLVRARDTAFLRRECVQVSTVGDVLSIQSFAPPSDNSCSGPFGASMLTLPEVRFNEAIALSDFSSGGRVITFNVRGGLETAATVTMDIRDQFGAQATISIYPAIGQIRIQ